MSAIGTELLRVEGLEKHFPVTRGLVFQKEVGSVKAVDGVSFTLNAGETLGVVGESGCGKSTMARCIARLLEPTGGSIMFDGRDITHLDRTAMRPVRRDMMMVFQDPYASLNPRKRVGSIIGEPMEVHGVGSDTERKRRIQDLLEIVGLNPEHFNRFPHEFSGGQRQRIGIARALAINPRLIICDEPVSALDVSIRSQILNLLRDLQNRLGLAYIFVSHDLAVVKHIADRVAVMNLGTIVETADAPALFASPRHPYSRALLSAIPLPRPSAKRTRTILQGEMPSALKAPRGCGFHPRCAHAIERCRVERPQLSADAAAHLTACHRAGELPGADAILPRNESLTPALERLVAAFSRGEPAGSPAADKTGQARPSLT